MLYTDLNDVRIRLNKLGYKLNEATRYGRQPLPAEFADIEREHNELMKVYMKPYLLKEGVEIVPADC